MSDRKRILETYTRSAAKFSDQYDSVPTEDVLTGIHDRLPKFYALDLGCGNGRDAQWLAQQGFHVDAMDGSEGMLKEAIAKHSHERVNYFHDVLPDMGKVRERGHKYDMIIMSAVWMHLKPDERAVALQHILEVAKPGATIFISLRHGTSPADRPMYEVSADELKKMAGLHMVDYEHISDEGDLFGRDVWWEKIYLRTPNDNLDALELIKGQVVQGRHSSTYKPALVLSLAEGLRENKGQLRDVSASEVELPFSAVAKPWNRIYQEATALDIPQHAASKSKLTNVMPHLQNSSEDPKEVERSILPVWRDGPMSHIRDLRSGHPVIQAVRADGGEVGVRFPRALADAIETYEPLVCTGAAEAIRRFLERHAHRSPEAIDRFVAGAYKASR